MAAAVPLLAPRAGVYLLVIAMYLRYSLPGLVGVYPADILCFLVITGSMAHRIARGESPIVQSRVNARLFLVAAVLALSLLAAYDLEFGLKNWLRHVQLFLLLVAIPGCIKLDDPMRIMRLILVLTSANSVRNIIEFIWIGGGARVFGPPGPFFEMFLAVVIVQCAIEVIFCRRSLPTLGWLLLFLLNLTALICTQSRTPMIQVVLAISLLVAICWYWSRRNHQSGIKGRAVATTAILAVVGIILLSGALTVFTAPASRIYQAVEGRSGTVAMRFYLWKTGLEMFLQSPVLGIGLGQVARWDLFLASWHLDPLAVSTRTMGAHNDFINYLAGTGMAGIAALFLLFARFWELGYSALRRAVTPEVARGIFLTWFPVCTIIIGFFLGPHTFYSLSGILAVICMGVLVSAAARGPVVLPGSPATIIPNSRGRS